MGGIRIPIIGWVILTIILLGGFGLAVKNNKLLLKNDAEDRKAFVDSQKRFDSQAEAFHKSVSQELGKNFLGDDFDRNIADIKEKK